MSATDETRGAPLSASGSEQTVAASENHGEKHGDLDLPPSDPSQPGTQAQSQAQSEPATEAPSKFTPPSPPPNGGLVAWLHVASAFMLFFNTWGILNAFGVYQTYYEAGELFTESSSNISWIGGIQSYCVLTTGLIAGPIYDKGYLRPLLAVGAFGVVFGHMMLSICNSYWQVLLAQGFCVGIGAGCLFTPCVAILPQYFSTKLGLAVGLSAAGSSLGGIIYPIVLYKLIDRIGFAWSTRVIGFIALATLLVPISVLKIRVKSPKARDFIDWTAFTDWPYIIFCLGSMIGFMGIYTILFYLSFFAENQHITTTSMAFYIIPIFNAASCFGRVLPNYLSDRLGPFNVIVPGALITGALAIAMIGVKTQGAIITIAVLAGFSSGVFIALPPVCFVALVKDKSKLGTRMGMGFATCGLGALAGGPGGGAILGQVDPLQWTGLWAFGGCATCTSALVYIGLRIWRNGFRFEKA